MRSNFVTQIIQIIKSQPERWEVIKKYNPEECKISGIGITDGYVRIINHGNPRFAAIESIYIDGIEIPTTYIDRWALHVAIKQWFKKVSINQLIKS